MEKPRPKLALFVSKASLRLQLVSALSEAYRVQVIDADEGPVRAFRRERPAVVLLCAQAREMRRMGSMAHALKTEQRPALVGLIAVAGLPPSPEDFLKQYLLDGLCSLPHQNAVLRDWVLSLQRGERPVVGQAAPTRGLRGALRRLSGSRAFSEDE